MDKKNRREKKDIIKIVLMIMASLLLIFFAAGFLLMHNYINKIHYEQTSRNSSETADQILAEEGENQQPGDMETSAAAVAALENAIRKNMEENSIPIRKDDHVLNVLVIGTDSRKSAGPGRTDTIIIESINEKSGKIVTTSLLRDIYLQIPGKNNNRINTAYLYGGANLLMDTIEQNFKIKMDRYVLFDFYSFIDVVDMLGGITVDVTEEDLPIINDSVKELNQLLDQPRQQDILKKTGTLLLNGKQALGYVRNRYVGSDFNRTAKQRMVLEQIFTKVKDLNLIEINKLLNLVLPQLTTNLTKGEIFSIILSLPTYRDYSQEQLMIPVKGTYSYLNINGKSVIGIDFQKNIAAMQKLIYE